MKKFVVNGQSIHITKRELELLKRFAEGGFLVQGRPLSRMDCKAINQLKKKGLVSGEELPKPFKGFLLVLKDGAQEHAKDGEQDAHQSNTPRIFFTSSLALFASCFVLGLASSFLVLLVVSLFH